MLQVQSYLIVVAEKRKSKKKNIIINKRSITTIFILEALDVIYNSPKLQAL